MRIIGLDPSFTACGISDGQRHEIISTKPLDGEDHFGGLARRSAQLVNGIMDFVHPRDALFIEAPMMAAPAHGGNHLFDIGWLMNDILAAIHSEGCVSILVPILSVKKFASGKGNTKKDEMKLAVFKKWGVEFEKDPGCDKLHAFVLHKIGVEVLAGRYQVAPIARRGKGRAA